METKAISPVITKQQVIERINTMWNETQRPLLVGVSGLGASGKSTLAEQLHREIAGSCLVEVDDFYRTEKDRAGEHRSEAIISNKFNWDHLDSRVFGALAGKRDIHYQRCRREIGVEDTWVFHPVEKVIILEGIYLFQNKFIDKFDFRIWVETPHDVRLRRGIARDELTRDGDREVARISWETIWMPQDQRYFDHERPDLRADAIIYGIYI